MLNCLYSRLGLNYQEFKTKLVTSQEAKELTLFYKVMENFVIDDENDLEFIKYSLEPSDMLEINK
jgi:hypothetical protein